MYQPRYNGHQRLAVDDFPTMSEPLNRRFILWRKTTTTACAL
nr:MAG TPA: hypothetical protein [Caudoviricetes sp.]